MIILTTEKQAEHSTFRNHLYEVLGSDPPHTKYIYIGTHTVAMDDPDQRGP